ncbi:hypothetical protein PC41400_08080 [Paenibacillus chitinolyticus]|uniref:HK97 gp10 family phage protein n=1 Tax=Paenibacillus chitinolyticus TaxID=79263 RepID=A0A410WTG0_9BACL|nr:hypothetical protein [Paenibacillus chitinolyticus]MCY9594030.1 hypothetical protein [Paenibacillus chitinolyticus]MCY9599135.1 hypothetical protein [Paenibacillus chitinolyticus]QAV17624.1 hypothetical protein PC41400_08080 [Paenibacillus chitinolyticus]
MPDFNSIKELQRYIQTKANLALKNEVATNTVEAMMKKIDEVVYDVYEPKVYEREKDHGGLTDPNNIRVQMINDDTVSIENIRSDGNRNVVEIVETGQGYYYSFDYTNKPRAFTGATRQELKTSKSHIKAMKLGLERQGIRTEQ